MKKLFRFLLCVTVAAILSLTAFAATGVTRSTVTIGGATANVIYIDMNVANRAIVPAIANRSISTDAPASNVLSTVQTGKVVAAINGGFFDSYYDSSAAKTVASGNYPRVYSTIMMDGQMVCAGGNIAAVGMDYSGDVYIDLVKLSPIITLRGKTDITAWGVNTIYTDPAAVYVLTDAFNYPVNIPASSMVVTIQNKTVTSVAGGRNGYITPDGVITVVYGFTAYQNAMTWNAQPVVGESAVFRYSAVPSDTSTNAAWNNMRTVIGGGGILVKNGVSMVDHVSNPTAADQRPDVVGQRSFVAKLNDGRLMLGTVSSSFRTIANALIAMGAKDAVFMDGGASSALYCDGYAITSPGRKLATMLAVVDETVAAQKPDTSIPANANAPSSWAQTSVERARSLGILPSHLDSDYKRNITRKEFCDLIANFIRAKTGLSIEYTCQKNEIFVSSKPYHDSNDYYVPYVSALGIVTGYPDGTFRPGDSIKRQDAAIMLQRLATFLDANTGSSTSSFTDAAQISAYAKSGVDFVVSLGIMNGNANGTFSPHANITREQAIITMVNAYQNIR